MKKAQRYDTSHLIESQFEPGSNEQVLKNMNFRDKDLAGVEAALLRASKRARTIAEQTNTPLVVYEEGRVVKKFSGKGKSKQI